MVSQKLLPEGLLIKFSHHHSHNSWDLTSPGTPSLSLALFSYFVHSTLKYTLNTIDSICLPSVTNVNYLRAEIWSVFTLL